jgi:hypothetical protein
LPHFGLFRPIRVRSRAATGMAAPARCIWAAPRSTWRRKWRCPRPARSRPTYCRPMRAR